jgi:hypothetical protein
MRPKERTKLALEAGISGETLRHILKRQSLHADTLIRLLLARGVSVKTITNLPQTDLSKLSEAEVEWLEFGRELTAAEKVEFVALIKYVRAMWMRLSG